MNYIKRTVEDKALSCLENPRALFILGARQVGKTYLLKHLIEVVGKERSIYFDLENQEQLRGLSGDVTKVLAYIRQHQNPVQGKTYLFIDEIQYYKDFSRSIKYLVDHYSDEFKLVLTGSSSLLIKKSFSESLVGRKDILELYPLSFSEYCRFVDESWLADQTLTLDPAEYHKLGVDKEKLKRLIADYIVFGAYPQIVLARNKTEKIELLRDTINSYILKDVKNLFRIEKIDQFNDLIRYLAVNLGKELNIQAISKTVGLYRDTVQNHLIALSEAYIINQVKPLYRNLNTEIRKMPKVYFVDTGVRNAILNNFNTLDMQADRGEQFENFIFNQLFLSRNITAEIRFWKTRNGQEIDFILLEEDRITAYEVKYGVSHKNHFSAFQAAYPKSVCKLVSFNQG